MKIKQTVFAGDEYGDGERVTIEVNGRLRVSAGGGEPEDNTLGRDLSFVFDIVALMREAHEAGRKGEPLEVEKAVLEDE
jgi:hypothetical protein